MKHAGAPTNSLFSGAFVLSSTLAFNILIARVGLHCILPLFLFFFEFLLLYL